MKLKAVQIKDGLYRVWIDGRETGLFIEKGEPPRYGYPQTWEVYAQEGNQRTFVFAAPSQSGCITRLRLVLAACNQKEVAA